MSVFTTTSQTFAVGDQFTASWQNTYVRDLIYALQAWNTWTPTIVSTTGTITSYTLNAARYRRIGKTVTAAYDFTITNNGTGATSITLTLPVASGYYAVGVGRETVVSGLSHAGTLPASSSTLTLNRYDNAYVGATNARLVGSITYEID